MHPLRAAFEETRRAGHKLLVPYVMAGVPDAEMWPRVLEAATGSADAIEIGLPFSDPIMDGPVIAGAAERALRMGIGPHDALRMAVSAGQGVPRLAMTYYNPVHRMGEAPFCRALADAGFSGLIVPDLPPEESAGLRRAAGREGIAWVPLVAPTSSRGRVAAAVAGATGFVYAVSALGVTGARASLSERAEQVVAACRRETDVPVLVGIGITTPEQAVEAASSADGVVVGSAVVGLVMQEHPKAAAAFLARVRSALDAM